MGRKWNAWGIQIGCQYDFIASYSHAARCCLCLRVQYQTLTDMALMQHAHAAFHTCLGPLHVANLQILSKRRRSMSCEEFGLGVGFGDTVGKRKFEVLG